MQLTDRYFHQIASFRSRSSQPSNINPWFCDATSINGIATTKELDLNIGHS